jgi:hypothetical protein
MSWELGKCMQQTCLILLQVDRIWSSINLIKINHVPISLEHFSSRRHQTSDISFLFFNSVNNGGYDEERDPKHGENADHVGPKGAFTCHHAVDRIDREGNGDGHEEQNDQTLRKVVLDNVLDTGLLVSDGDLERQDDDEREHNVRDKRDDGWGGEGES